MNSKKELMGKQLEMIKNYLLVKAVPSSLRSRVLSSSWARSPLSPSPLAPSAPPPPAAVERSASICCCCDSDTIQKTHHFHPVHPYAPVNPARPV